MSGNLGFDWGDGIDLKNENNGNRYYANLRVHYAPDASPGTTTFYLNPSIYGSSETLATLNTSVYKVPQNNNFSTILEALKSSSVPPGLSAINVQTCTDNPAGSGVVATAMIFKHNREGTYSYIWVFSGTGLWLATVSSTIPSSLSFTKKI